MRKEAFILMLLLMAGIHLPMRSLAAPAAEIPYVLEQPDGVRFEAVDKGDEWNNRTETVEGYTISQEADDFWYYVEEYVGDTPVVGNVPADGVPPLQLERHLQPELELQLAPPGEDLEENASAAPYGSFSGPILFILTSFNDQAGSTTESSWASFISNNIADFFDKTSHGKLSLTPANETSGTVNNGVVGWVNVGYNHPNTGGSTGQANRQLSRDAILAADPYVNFAAYDANSDGYVDSNELAVVVIAAGYERSYSSSYTPNVWGHKWSVSPVPTVDGVFVGAYNSGAGGYAQFGELHQSTSSNQHQATMGIMVHELGHLIFGLPDLYDTDGSSSGIGAFGVMGGGSWGKASSDTYSGETPVLASAWTKYNRGWANGTEGSGTVSITASGSTTATSANTVYRASTGITNEYFLVENRQPLGYDQGLERYFGASFGGMAIWHIDDSQTSNSNDSHRWVDLEEADGTLMGSSSGQATDLWYSGNASTFNAASNPNSNLYSGSASGVDINNISSAATVMTAAFGSGCSVPGAATLASPNGTITSSTPTYSWNAVSSATWYYLWVDDSSGNKIAQWYTAAQVGCSSGTGTCSVTPSTTLADGAGTWWVQTWNSCGYGSWSSGMSFTVTSSGPPTAATLVSPTGTTSDSTPAYSWNAVSSATWYYLWVDDSSGNKITQWYTAADAGCSSGTGTCSVTPSTTLADGTGMWWVLAWNSYGYGPWSSGMSFTVSSGPPPAATLVSPTGTTSNNTPTYSWNAVSSATWYYLWVDDSTGNRIAQWYTAAQVGCTSGTGTCSVTPATVLASGAGMWWVMTWNSYGYGPWSSGMSFTVSGGGGSGL